MKNVKLSPLEHLQFLRKYPPWVFDSTEYRAVSVSLTGFLTIEQPPRPRLTGAHHEEHQTQLRYPVLLGLQWPEKQPERGKPPL
jgi:hypothetical protein